MAKLLTPAPKFTHPEWNYSNQVNYSNAEGERAVAERLVEESKRLVDETASKTTKTQRDVNKKLGTKKCNNSTSKIYQYLICYVMDYNGLSVKSFLIQNNEKMISSIGKKK